MKIKIGGIKMRRTRIRSKKNKRNNSLALAIFFLIVIPIVAVFIGSRITERIVIPVLRPDSVRQDEDLTKMINSDDFDDIDPEFTTEENSKNEYEKELSKNEFEEDVYINILPLSVYMIQVASVSDTTNIEKFVEELNEKELSHLIYKLDNAYKVYTLGSTDRKFVENQLPMIRQYYPDAYISEIHLPSKKISYSKTDNNASKNIVNDLNSLIEIIDKQAEEWYNFINKEKQLDQYKQLLVEQQSILEELLTKVNNNDIPSELPNSDAIEKMIFHQENNIKSSLEILKENEKIYRVHSLFLDSLFRIVETIK